MKSDKKSIETLQRWIAEATEMQEIWHRESWEDCKFVDGEQWTEEEVELLDEKEIIPLTVNRIFPVVKLVYGFHVNNSQDIVAKGRTQDDSETSQVMTESLKYVLDQCDGQKKTMAAFKECLTAGFGYLKADTQSDPRREKVTVQHHPWYTFAWDIYGDPQLDPQKTRYCFYYDWKDLDDVIALFPERKQELEEEFRRMGDPSRLHRSSSYDIVDELEQRKQELSGSRWADTARRRIRPVEMYYTVRKKCFFARMENAAVYELSDDMPPAEQLEIMNRAVWTGWETVVKIRMAILVGNIILQDVESPHSHDRFPFIPFYCYLDRFGMPYGIPRQIKEPNKEVNRRRSMALAQLDHRRMIVEDDAVEDVYTAYDEMNQRKGMIRTRPGKIDKVRIHELSDLSAGQIELMAVSEREIKEIAGANDESLGYATKVMSGAALERKQQQSSTMTADIAENLAYSRKRLGELLIAEIQANWTERKVLRITDRQTGADRWVTINEEVRGESGELLEVRNNLANGRFDSVVSTAMASDTIKERNIDLLFEAVKKLPPEASGEIINMALELSDLPNKDLLLSRLRGVLGVGDVDPSLSKDEQEQKEQEQREALEEKQNADAQLEHRRQQLELAKMQAEIEKMKAEVTEKTGKAEAQQQEQASRQFEDGYRMQQELMIKQGLGSPIGER